ncbi:hypothetical protein Tco_0136868, partial [Tanacetum coccineum]
MATCHHLSGATWRKHCSPPLVNHRSTAAGPLVNGGQRRQSTVVNSGLHRWTTAGPPVNGGRLPVKAGQQLGHGSGQ